MRPPGSATVDVQRLPDGRAVIRLVTDDMPFLVDSVTAEVVRQGVTLAHIVHPVVVVRRDLRGRIKAFCDSSLAVGCGSDALTESWMAVVLDGPLDDEAAADLVAGLRTVLDDVRAVDEDAERLRARVLELAGRLDELAGAAPPARTPTRPTTPPRPPRCCAGWPTATSSSSAPATSTSSPARGKLAARAVPGTGLGVLRSDTDMSEPSAGMPEATRSPAQHLLAVTKADARSTVHRRAWLDLIAVSLPATDGGAPASTASSGCSRRRRTRPASSTSRWCAAGSPR